MTMTGKRVVFGVLVVLLMVLPLVAACSKPAPTPTPSPKPTVAAPKTTAPTTAVAPKTTAPAKTTAPVASPTTKPVAKVPDKLKWNLSLWGAPRAVTYPIEDWAKAMKEATGGRWEIAIQYGEVLSPSANIPDALKANMIEAGMYTSMYHPGKTPLQTVMQNPFLGMPDLITENEWFLSVNKHPAIQKELDNWNMYILFPTPTAQYNLISKKKIATVEDLKGTRIRIDAVSGKPFQKYGATLNNITGGEVYSALDKGIIDTVCWIYSYTFASYKLHELAKNITLGIDLKNTDMFLACSQTAWKALPDEWKKLSNDWIAKNAAGLFVKYNDADDVKNIAVFKSAGVTTINMAAAERQKLVDAAKESWDSWAAEQNKKGLPGTDVLAFAIKERERILAAAKK